MVIKTRVIMFYLLRNIGLSLFFHAFTYAQTPGAVQNLALSDIRQWGFTANWDPPASGNSPVLYNVSVTNGNNGDEDEMQFPPNIHGSYVMGHLYDDTLYFISVTAVDALNTAGTSASATVLVPPCELCIIKSESGRTFFKMRLRPPLPFPSVVSGYAVDSAAADNARGANLLKGSEQVLISGLQPGVLYQFEVKNNDTDEIVYVSRYRIAPDPVENLDITLVSRTSCIVTYEQPPTDVGQKIDGYRIVSRPTNSGNEDIFMVDSTQTSVLIEDLIPSIEYTIEVQTFSGQNADLNYSSQQNATVVRVDFVLARHTNTSLTLDWEPPIDGNHVSFQVHYGILDTGDVDHISINASSNTTTITGLLPGQEYQVELYLVSQEGLLSFYSSAVFQTEPNAVSGITWTSTATSISLTWNHPPGRADSYIIEYEPSSTTGTLVTDKLSLTLTGLSPGLFYMVNITTVFGTARSPPTTATFQTDTLSPGELEVDAVTLDSIGVTWGAMPDTVEYVFTISPSEGDEDEGVSNQRVEFTNLTPGKLFTISLLFGSTLVQNGSQNSSLQIRTLPAAPHSLVVTPVEPVNYIGLHLAWAQPPKGEWDRIRIIVTQVGGLSDDVLIEKTDTSYVLKNLNPDTLYTIGISSVSGLDDTQQESDPVIQRATTDRLPNATMIITSYDQYSVTVDWHWPPAVPYIALCREVGRELGEDYKGVIEPSPSTSIMRFTYEDLIPGRNYEFLIRRSDDNRLIKVFQRTVPSSPSHHNSSALGAESIRVDWSGTSNDFERFEITVYPSSGGNGVQHVKTMTGDVISTTIDGLLEDTNYTTEVRAISGSGQSLEKSVPSTATAATEPVIMEILTLSIETVLPVGFIPISGSFDAYRYGYRKFPDGQFSYTALSKTAPPFFDIEELRPGALYEITLDIRNGSTYTEVDRIQARTKPSTPTILPVTNLEDKSFTVNWILPSLLDVDFIGCYLSYEPIDGAMVSSLFLDQPLTSHTLTGLEPATRYVVTLVTVSGEDSSEQISFPETTTVTTADGIPGSVNIKEVTTSLIRITWNEVRGVSSYTPHINPDEGKVTQLIKGATFKGLTPGQLYTISIQWIGNSGPATQLYTQPKPPLALTITRTAASELDISWRPPPEGSYDSYKLTYSQLLTNDITTVTVLGSDDPSITLQDLISETSYDVSVVSVRGTRVSEPVKIAGTTGRRVYDVLTLVGRTTTTISVTWSASTDPSSEEYEIWIKPSGGVLQLVTTLQLSTDTYTLTNLISGTTYVVSLVITGLDRREDLEVTTYPLTPGFIHIFATTQTCITFSWGRSTGNFDCYSIFFFKVGSEVAFLQDFPRGDTLTISKNFLTAGTKYKIQIYTKTGSTTSAPAETTISTDIELLVFDPVGNFGLRISWKNAMEAEHYFLEKILPNGMTNSPIMTTERNLELNDVVPGQPYTFRLSSDETVNGIHELGEATYMSAPLAPSVEVRNISPSSVNVRITADRLGVVDHFIVDAIAQQTSLDLGHRRSTSFKIPTEACPEVTLTNLIPGRAYTVQVTAISEETSSAAIRINVTLATLKPGVVFLNDKTSTSIEVIWGAVTDTFRNYVVYLLDGLTRLQTNQHGINEEHKTFFEGLLPGSQYTIALMLESEGGGLIQQSILSVTTAPETPKNLSFLSVLGHEVTLGWPMVISNIDHYELCWTPYNRARYPSRDSTQQSITLQPLDADYTISLYTVIGDGGDQTRSGGVTCAITLLKDETTTTTKESFTEASTNSSTEMTSGVSFATPVKEQKDIIYIVIGIVSGFIVCCTLVIFYFIYRWGVCTPAWKERDPRPEPRQRDDQVDGRMDGQVDENTPQHLGACKERDPAPELCPTDDCDDLYQYINDKIENAPEDQHQTLPRAPPVPSRPITTSDAHLYYQDIEDEIEDKVACKERDPVLEPCPTDDLNDPDPDYQDMEDTAPEDQHQTPPLVPAPRRITTRRDDHSIEPESDYDNIICDLSEEKQNGPPYARNIGTQVSENLCSIVKVNSEFPSFPVPDDDFDKYIALKFPKVNNTEIDMHDKPSDIKLNIYEAFTPDDVYTEFDDQSSV